MTTCAVWFSQQIREVVPGGVEVTTHMGKECAPVVWLFTQSSKPEPQGFPPHSSHLLSSAYLLSFRSILIITLNHPTLFFTCFLPGDY